MLLNYYRLFNRNLRDFSLNYDILRQGLNIQNYILPLYNM